MKLHLQLKINNKFKFSMISIIILMSSLSLILSETSLNLKKTNRKLKRSNPTETATTTESSTASTASSTSTDKTDNATPNLTSTAASSDTSSSSVAAQKVESLNQSLAPSSSFKSESSASSMVTNPDGSVTQTNYINGVKEVKILKGEEAKAAIAGQNQKINDITKKSLGIFNSISNGLDILPTHKTTFNSNGDSLINMQSFINNMRKNNLKKLKEINHLAAAQNAFMGRTALWSNDPFMFKK